MAELHYQIAGRLIERALEEQVRSLPPDLVNALVSRAGVPSQWVSPGVPARNDSPLQLARLAIRHVAAASKFGRVALLIDGLEKLPIDRTDAVFDALSALLDEPLDLAVVAPWHAVVGPGSDNALLRLGRVVAISPVDVAASEDARRFLVDVVQRRLGVTELSPALRQIVLDAAELSGGIIRTFLQLLVDAAGYGRLNGRENPSPEDLADAAADQRDSLRRLLVKDDLSELMRHEGSDGAEIPLDKRIRLLTHGLLLEYAAPQRATRVAPHPLIRPATSPRQG